jgi:hypothetical protein
LLGLLAPQVSKCGANGCSACDTGATAMLVAGTVQLSDPQYCITEYCDEVMPGMPQNPYLYRRAGPVAGQLRVYRCDGASTNQFGC